MKTVTVPILSHHSGQKAVLRQVAYGLKHGQRTFVWEAGRRVGKTALNQDIAIRNLLHSKLVGYWVPSYKDGRKIFSHIVDCLGGKKSPLIKRINSQLRTIELVNGGEFDMWSLDKDGSGRGYHYDIAILDEAAKAKDLTNQINETIGATVTDNDGYILITSTPRGVGNEFHRLWLKGQYANHEYRSFRTPTYANPHIKLNVLLARKRALIEDGFEWVWQQEYLARPADNGVNPFSTKTINRQTQKHVTNRTVVAWAIDLAKKLDFTVVFGFDDKGKIAQYHRWTNIPWPEQEKRIKQITASAPQAQIIIDATGSGDPMADYLVAAGLPIIKSVLSRSSRPKLLRNYLIALSRGDAWVLAGQHKTELLAAEYKESNGDLDIRIAKPEHDDCMMAAALGTQLLNKLGYPRNVLATGHQRSRNKPARNRLTTLRSFA